MLSFASLYPKIDLSDTFYEDISCRIGVNHDNYYLVSKLDGAVILFERTLPQKIMTFIDLILVDKVRCNSMKRLYPDLRETDGSGRSRFKASEIRFILENKSAQVKSSPSLEDIHSAEIDLLKNAYLNDCSTHISVSVSRQIKQFMQYSTFYEIRIKELEGFINYNKLLAVIDEVNEKIYKAVVRDNVVYFNNPLYTSPLKEPLARDKFTLNDYNHYEELSGCVIDLFKLNNGSIESHYSSISKKYSIYFKREISDGQSVTIEVDEKTIHQDHYDVNFLFDFVFDTEIIHCPRPSFVERLIDLDILADGETMEVEHLRLYEMTII